MHGSASRTPVLSVVFVLLAAHTLVLCPPRLAVADFATPFVEIHNQVGEVSKGRGYVVALSHEDNPKRYLVIVTTDTMNHVVIQATAEKDVVPSGLLGLPVIVEGKIAKRDEDEKTRQVTVELQILSVERPARTGAAESPKGAAGLGFLSDVPEFRDLHLGLTEDELQSLIRAKNLLVTVVADGREKSYHVYRDDGENAMVMFRDGECSGVQRLRCDVSGVPESE